jgi:hypothetical protein
MGNAWESAKGLARKHAGSGGIFVRLATSGDKVTGVFCGATRSASCAWHGYVAWTRRSFSTSVTCARPLSSSLRKQNSSVSATFLFRVGSSLGGCSVSIVRSSRPMGCANSW